MKHFFILLFACVSVKAQIINTIAGGGTIATNIPATKVLLNQPSGVALDVNGNVYFTDPAFSIVRKIATSGILTTFAGTGIVGHSNMGMQAATANINGPLGIVRDALGNTYFCDSPNNLIYKVGTSGIITVYAGTPGIAGSTGDNGPATSAKLNFPQGLAIDIAGNIYVADNGNNKIRKIASSTGWITTVAGNGTQGSSGNGVPAITASLNQPFGVCVDKAGNIYIADTYNYKIRKVNTSGIISNFAGSGLPFSSGDGGAALSAGLIPIALFHDSISGSLFLSDFAGNKIRKINTSNIISNVAGDGTAGFAGDNGLATVAKLNFPRQVVVKTNGEVYFADGQNQRIRKVSTTGIITTVAGKYPDPFEYPNNARIQPSYISLNRANGLIYFSDYFGYSVRKLNLSNGLLSPAAGNGTRGFSGDGNLATLAQLDTVLGVCADTSGIYICDAGNSRIRKVNNNGIITTIAGTGVNGYNGDNILATSAKINFPVDLKIFNNKLIFIDNANGRVRKIDLATGIITTIFGLATGTHSGDNGPATAADFRSLSGMDIDNVGNMYFADYYAHVIRKINNTTGIVTTIAGNANLPNFTGDNGLAISANLNTPMGVACDNLGNIYVSDAGNFRIRKIDVSGTINTISGNGISAFSGDGGSAALAQLGYPQSLRVDANSNSLIFCDAGSNRIRMISNVAVPDICIVGTDPLSKYNEITWEKTNYFNVDSFLIYREVSASPVQYAKVGALSNLAYSEFNDTNRVFFTNNSQPNGNPKITTYKYKIRIRDLQNNFSFLSNFHNTVYINDLGNGSFQWNLYTIENKPNPISGYNLLRDTIGDGSWHLVGTTTGSQNILVDPLYTTYQSRANWRVDGLGLSCTPSLKTASPTVVKNKTKSNTKDNFTLLAGVQTKQGTSVILCPNPSSDIVTIVCDKNITHINVYNTFGQLIRNIILDNNSIKYILNVADYSSGVYTVEVKTNSSVLSSKIVVMN